MKPKLTIGMAAYDDFDGPYFTLQSLRMGNDLSNVELLLIDNHPDSIYSKSLSDLCNGWLNHGTAGARYIPYDEIVGTSMPRNKVFEYAQGDAVMCMDSHVLLYPGTINKLLDWYEKNPETKDLMTGPLVMDNLTGMATHFIDFWRSEMWGIWGSAWETPDKRTRFSVLEEDGRAKFIHLAMGQVPVNEFLEYTTTIDPKKFVFPIGLQYNGHQQALVNLGCTRLGENDTDEFEIPGQGLGLFTCRKSAWLGFNPEFRGFGGEEMYIHEKYRQAGHKCLNLGFLKWVHRFGRPAGITYPLNVWNKVRNYVLGHRELGLPIDNIRKHFLEAGLIPTHEWESLLDNPSRPLPIIMPAAPPKAKTVEDIYEEVKAIPRDLNEHMDALRILAGRCDHVTEISNRRESFVAIVAASPKTVISYNTERDNQVVQSLLDILDKDGKVDAVCIKQTSDEIPSIEETDMLFIDSMHTYERLSEELHKYASSVKRYIAVHDIELFGETGEDGGRGLVPAMQEFLKANEEWNIVVYQPRQFGLIVLSVKPGDKPEQKIIPWIGEYGPGTELKKILESLGIKSSPTCDCRKKARQMDQWGIDGCKEHRDEIVQWILDNQRRWGWKDRLEGAAESGEEIEPPKSFLEKAKVAWKTVSTGLIFKLSATDPVGSLVDEAIRRAEVKKANGEYDA